MDLDHDSAESLNTGGAETAAAPEINTAEERSKWVARGVQEGVKRTLQKLGLGADIDAALEQLEGLKTPPDIVSQETQGGDVRETAEFRSLAKEHREATKELVQLKHRVEQLAKQADEARLEKLRAAALGKGVGSGQQLEAFIRLYGDKVRFDDDRNLEVLSAMGDGTFVAAGQSLDDFLDEVLGDSKFLLAPSAAPSGVGSRKEPVVEAKKTSLGLLDSLRGVKKG